MTTVYTKEGCPKCKALKLKLDMKKIEYAECQDLERLIELGFKSLPVLEIDNQLFAFEKAIKYLNER